MSTTNRQSHLVDLRSDTVTRPTPAMYEAMRSTPIGDDVLGDDPTVIELEALAALRMGKEAALFVPSGTMGNQIALACHCARGDGVILEEESHILYYEVGAPAILSQVVTWTLPSARGAMDPENVDRHVAKASLHTPGTALICIENTHNRAGGAVIPLDHLRRYRECANRHGIKVHMDGARVFNAAAALGIEAIEIARYADTITFCLSKGLGAPVGSLLCGSGAFIESARIWRKRLGGGMRQAGILAACGIVSLNEMLPRLKEDHDRARRLATALGRVPGLRVDLSAVETNMVMVDTEVRAVAWQQLLEQGGLLCLPTGEHRLRLVFHADVDDAKTTRAEEIFEAVSRKVS